MPDHVVVVDPRRRAGLLDEALLGRRVAAVLRVHDLDRHPLAQRHVLREHHLAHAAVAEGAQDPIAALEDAVLEAQARRPVRVVVGRLRGRFRHGRSARHRA
jgi:hypothetical protein